MSLIEYTAKRTMASGHAANSSYAIELEVVEATPSVADIKQVERAPGGAMETTFERQDITWTIRLAPVCGHDVELMREFLDSTESGEYFRIWLWPEDANPLSLKRIEDGHAESAFMRRGSEGGDYFEAQFTGLQVARYSSSGTAESSSGGFGSGGSGGSGGGSNDGETTDIYSPDVGGSGGILDPESNPLGSFFTITAGELVGDPTTETGFSESTSIGTLDTDLQGGAHVSHCSIEMGTVPFTYRYLRLIILSIDPLPGTFNSITIPGVGTFTPDTTNGGGTGYAYVNESFEDTPPYLYSSDYFWQSVSPASPTPPTADMVDTTQYIVTIDWDF